MNISASHPTLPRRSRVLRPVARQSPLLIGIIAVLVIGAQLSQYFLTVNNFRNILITGAVVSVLAVGQFMVIVTAGIDLSVGAVASFSTVLLAVLLKHGTPSPLAIVAVLAACALIGIVNGLLVVFGGITPFIATLGMMGVAQGLAYLVQNGTYVSISDKAFLNLFAGEAGSIPNPVVVFVIVTILFGALMRWTAFGRQLYAIGGNSEAARLSGLPVRRDVISAYATSALLAGLAGFMLAASLGEGSSQLGQGLELDSIAAAVVGGASLFGGAGSPVAAVLGGLLIGVISNIMNLRGVQAEPQLIIKGTLILFAVFLTSGRGAGMRKVLARQAGSLMHRTNTTATAAASATAGLPAEARSSEEHKPAPV